MALPSSSKSIILMFFSICMWPCRISLARIAASDGGLLLLRRSCNGGAPPPRKIDMPIADCDMTDGPPPRVPPNGVVPGREPATVDNTRVSGFRRQSCVLVRPAVQHILASLHEAAARAIHGRERQAGEVQRERHAQNAVRPWRVGG